MKTLFGPAYAALSGSRVIDCDYCKAKLQIVDSDFVSKHFETDRWVGSYTQGTVECPHCSTHIWVAIDKGPEKPLSAWEKIFGRDYGTDMY